MDDLVRQLASEALEKEPRLVQIFDDFQAAQEEFVRLLDLMGARHVAVELPPSDTTTCTLDANVSGANR